jgi:acetyl esterase/lipase
MSKTCILFLVCAVYLASALNCTTYHYKQVSDLKIKLAVCTPEIPAPEGGYPVFFVAHGGGYVAGNCITSMTGQELTEALNRGWAVVSIDYRLLPSVTLEEIFTDVQDAYAWVRTELVKFTRINPDSIIVFGGSAGGGLAVLSGYKLTPRPKVIIGFYAGMTNWTDPFAYDPTTPVPASYGTDAKKFSVPVVAEFVPINPKDPKIAFWNTVFHNHKIGWLMTTHDPNAPTDQVMAKLREFSAVEHVDQNYPPTYLAHGTADTIVPYTQSVQLADKLKANNIDYVLDLVPGAEHSFDGIPKNWEQHVLPAFEFAQKYVAKSSKKFLAKQNPLSTLMSLWKLSGH